MSNHEATTQGHTMSSKIDRMVSEYKHTLMWHKNGAVWATGRLHQLGEEVRRLGIADEVLSQVYPGDYK
jgi:hypothetical protein